MILAKKRHKKRKNRHSLGGFVCFRLYFCVLSGEQAPPLRGKFNFTFCIFSGGQTPPLRGKFNFAFCVLSGGQTPPLRGKFNFAFCIYCSHCGVELNSSFWLVSGWRKERYAECRAILSLSLAPYFPSP